VTINVGSTRFGGHHDGGWTEWTTMSKIDNQQNGKKQKNRTATAHVEPKRREEAFRPEAVEHWLRSGKSGMQIADYLRAHDRRLARRSRHPRLLQPPLFHCSIIWFCSHAGEFATLNPDAAEQTSLYGTEHNELLSKPDHDEACLAQ
jgi:hypothetical protein